MAACDKRGTCTLLNFLDTVGANFRKDSDHMLQLLERVAKAGPPRNAEVCHKIQDDIWEFIKGRVRVFWFYDEGRLVVCTHGMIKSTQRTPKGDIEQALRVKAEYFSAKQQGHLVIEEDNHG